MKSDLQDPRVIKFLRSCKKGFGPNYEQLIINLPESMFVGEYRSNVQPVKGTTRSWNLDFLYRYNKIDGYKYFPDKELSIQGLPDKLMIEYFCTLQEIRELLPLIKMKHSLMGISYSKESL